MGKSSRAMKHMFTLSELVEDASLILDLKEDVREECETLGEVTNVVLYDVRVMLILFFCYCANSYDRKNRKVS